MFSKTLRQKINEALTRYTKGETEVIECLREIVYTMNGTHSNIEGTLEAYIRKMNEKGIIDHSIRASVWGGKVLFYIHPAMVGGDTVNFELNGNELETISYSSVVEEKKDAEI